VKEEWQFDINIHQQIKESRAVHDFYENDETGLM
jgi:hypothetical protein